MPDQSVEAFAGRLGTVLAKAGQKLPADARASLAALVSPENLAIMAAVLVAWVVGHAFGVGELIDIVIGVVGIFSVGMAVFSGLDELFAFARATYGAETDKDIDVAADHLARAIAILGITAVLALLFKGRPQAGREIVHTPAPPIEAGLRYKPKTTIEPSFGPGEGQTNAWGDIELASQGSLKDKKLAMFHEQVHQILTPKFYKLRRFRVERKEGSYWNSSLYRYIEEALAETVAQVGVNGLSTFFVGLRFPLENEYVYILRGGGYSTKMAGKGLLPEGAGLFAAGTLQGFAYQVFIKAGRPRSFAKPKPPGAAALPPPPAVLKGAFSRATEPARR